MTDVSKINFGRIRSIDARDLKFPMRAMLPSSIPIVSRYYKTGPVLDQGETSQCVGYSWRQFLTSDPVVTTTGLSPQEIYREAQLVDEWPGEEPTYEGTSVRAGAKVLSTGGYLKSYVWAASATDIRDFLITTGTVVMGTDWTQSMFTPSADGVLKVTGRSIGGHAYLVCGFNADTNRFQMINSWGLSWGQSGMAWINFRDMDKLLRQFGEACAAVEHAIVPIVPTLDQLASQFTALKQRVDLLESKLAGQG